MHLFYSLFLAACSGVHAVATANYDNSSPLLRGSSDRELTTTFEFSSDCDYTANPPYYVSASGGNNWNSPWGLTMEKPFKTIQHAVDQREPCQIIYVMDGLYRNNYYGQSLNHNNKIVNLNNVQDLKIIGIGDQRPILEFDGPGGIFGGSASNPIANIEISNLEIRGPNEDITWEEAMQNRIIKRTHYNGRGIAIWAGHHIYIHDMVVHHCPASGIRVNRGDYITISHNEVYSNTWWSSSAESAVVLAASEHIDENEGIKMKLMYNTVYDNINKVPYYNPNYAWNYSPIGNHDCSTYTACEQELIEGCPWECRYGKKTQDYIIDGMGVYVTRNSDTYLHGQMELSYNTAYQNGINGLVFHRTHRGVVKQNVIYDNGVVPRLDKPEPIVEDWHQGLSKSRQSYSGLVLNNAEDVKLWSNNVVARYDDDYAFKQEVDGSGPPPPLAAGGNNKACQGLIDSNLADVVNTESDWSICGIKYVEIFCGDYCHLIQWPYNMGSSYNPETAEEECSLACDNGDCYAFSLQDDYRPGNEGLKLCFLYKESQEPSPEACQNDPFQLSSCTYATNNGQFFITPAAKYLYNVNDSI
mmetsp:Transcript_27583/g.41731  ORF Transcript_27583/g.41731 Transcript_27583/m.41731 type:complete len:585 (-) Transcript_27583:1085-2839(-)